MLGARALARRKQRGPLHERDAFPEGNRGVQLDGGRHRDVDAVTSLERRGLGRLELRVRRERARSEPESASAASPAAALIAYGRERNGAAGTAEDTRRVHAR